MSLRGPPCAHDDSGTPHGEVCDIGHDKSLPKFCTVCSRQSRSPDIESQNINTSKYLAAMVVGCAPALGKLSPRDLLNCFKDYDEPKIMRQGNVDIIGSRGGVGSPHHGM